MRRSDLKRSKLGRSRAIRQPSLYSRTDEIKEKRGTGWIYPLLFCLFLGAGIYFVFFSPYFRVNTVNFSDTKFVSREELSKVAADSKSNFLNNNIFTFGFFGFSKRLGEVTGVKSYLISRKFPNSININIEEKSPIFVWQILDHKYLVDDDGYVWANYEDKYAALPVIIDTKNVPVNIGSKVVPATFVVFAKELFANFETKSGTKAAKYEVLDIVSDLKLTSVAGWYVYFDTSRNCSNELTSLVRVLGEVQSKKKSLTYVDLRVDNRIFYK